MLPKQYRLRRSAAVQHVKQRGQVWRHPLAILLVTTNEFDVSRFAFAAGRSVGGAVVRNRAKRLLREVVRLNLADVGPGYDCLFIARGAAAKASYAQMETAVLTLLQRANLLAKSETVKGKGISGS